MVRFFKTPDGSWSHEVCKWRTILPVFNVDNISFSWIMSFYNDCFSQPFVFSGGNISETIEGAKLDSPRNARACN
jgi:hypothetical protein